MAIVNSNGKNLAIIGASYLQLPLIIKAKQLGYITHVFAWAANDVGEKEADCFYPISIIEKEKILEKCREIKICGICSIASDLAVTTVNYVAQKLGLNSNSMESSPITTNKHLMRNAFEKKALPSPKSVLVDENTDLSLLNFTFPVIVKPTDRSGSRGIFKIDNSLDLTVAVEKSIKQSFEKKALVEEFAEGQEYSVEYISYHGEHTFLAMTLKYTTGAPFFIETGHLEPAPVSDKILDEVKRIVPSALDSLLIKEGASHSELKIDKDGNIKIIEIGARMGGDCIGSDLVQISTGYDFLKMVIDVSVGVKPSFVTCSVPKMVAVKYIFNKNDLSELERIKSEGRLIRIVDYHPEKIGKITDSSNRAGCYLYYPK